VRRPAPTLALTTLFACGACGSEHRRDVDAGRDAPVDEAPPPDAFASAARDATCALARVDASASCGTGGYEVLCAAPAAEMGRFVDRRTWTHDTRGALFATENQLLVAAASGGTFAAAYDGARWAASTTCQPEGTTPFRALDGDWAATFSVSPLSSNGSLRISSLDGVRGWNFVLPSPSPFSATGALSGGTLVLDGTVFAYEGSEWSKSTLTFDAAAPVASLGHDRFAATGADPARVISRTGAQWQELGRFAGAQAIAMSPGTGPGTRVALGMAGSVRVLVSTGSGWTQEVELAHPDDDPDGFGRFLSLDDGSNGLVLAVSGSRRVYVYERTGSWTLLDRIPVDGRAVVRASRLFVYSEDSRLSSAWRAFTAVYDRQ
jgi:hypothetical protein